MKKLTKILIIALSVALLCGAFIFAVSAEETAPEATTHNAFRVENPGEEAVEFVTIAEAFSNVKAGGTITVIADYEDGPTRSQCTLSADKKNVTLNLNGHTISASYGTEKVGSEENGSGQKFIVYGSLTVVGNGVIKTATSAFLVGPGGSLTFNAGEGNTISLVALKSYEVTERKYSTDVFPGVNFIKINSASNTESTEVLNLATAIVNVEGNLKFTDEAQKGDTYLFAFSDSAVLNIENANINATNYGDKSGFIANHFNGTYQEDKYDAPEITIKNSVITAPYGTFFNGDNRATKYSDAVSLTVTGSSLKLVGNDFPKNGVGRNYGAFSTSNNSPIKIVMTDTTVNTESNFFYNNAGNVVPKVTIQLTDCIIDIDNATVCDDGVTPISYQNSINYHYGRHLFLGCVTAILDDTALVHDGSIYIDNIIQNTHAWGDYETLKTLRGVNDETGVVNGDPGYFEELGMGVLFKGGTVLVGCRDLNATPAAPGNYTSTFHQGYAFEAGNQLIEVPAIYWIGGVSYIAQSKAYIVSDKIQKLVFKANLQNAEVGSTTAGAGVPSGANFGDLPTDGFAKRYGKYTICGLGENKYMAFVRNAYGSETTQNNNYDPFVDIKGFDTIENIRFYSVEIDIASAELSHVQGTTYFPFYFNISGTNTEIFNIGFETDSSGNSWWKMNGTPLKSTTQFNPGENNGEKAGVWQHIQIIIETPVTDGGVDFTGDFVAYLYVDGTKVGSYTLPESSPLYSAAKTEKLNFIRLRFAKNDGGFTAVDNISATTYPINYSGSHDTIVTKNYKLESLPLVKVDGVGYNDFNAAVAKLVSLANDGYIPTLEYVMDVSSLTFDLSGAEAGAKFIFKTGGKALKLSSDYIVHNDDYLGGFAGEGEQLVAHKDYKEVKVEGKTYYNLDAAIAKLLELAVNGYVPTLEYVMDCSSYTFDLSGAATGAKFIFKTGEKALNLQSDYVVYDGAYAGELGEGETLVVHKYYNSFSTPHIQNIQSATTGTYTDGTKVEGSFGTNGLPVQPSRNGKYTVYEQADGNKYVAHTAQLGTNTYKHDQFIALGFNAGGFTGSTMTHPFDSPIDGYRFYSFEIDFASAELKHSRGDFVIDFLFRGGATRNGEFKERFTQYVGVYLSTDANGKSGWKIGNKDLKDAPVAAPGVWQHVQMIIEAPVVEYNEGSVKYSAMFDAKNLQNFKFHLYLDGVHAGTATLEEANVNLYNAFASNPDNAKNYDSLKNIAITEVRFRTAGKYYADDTGSTAFDNILMERYPINYIGDKNSGAAVLASVVNTEYTLPANLPLVNVDGTDYCTIADAVAALENGSTLEYLMDVSSLEFDLSAFEGSGAEFTFITKGNAPNLNDNALYIAEGSGDTYKVRRADNQKGETYIMTWYDVDGVTVLRTEEVLSKSNVIPVFKYERAGVENAYYKSTYNAWNYNNSLLTGETLTLTQNSSAKLMATVEATFADIQASLSLLDNIAFRVYTPFDFATNTVEGFDNVKFVEFQVNNAKKTLTNKATVNGKSYYYFDNYATYSAASLTGTYKITINYQVILDGYTYTLSRSFAASIIDYAKVILEDVGNIYDGQDKQHMANFVRSANEFVRLKTGKYNETINGAYTLYKELCTKYETNLLNDTKKDLGDLTNYIKDIGFSLFSDRGRYEISFKDDARVKGVVIKVTRRADGAVTTLATYDTTDQIIRFEEDGVKYFSIYRTGNTRIYDLFGDLEITLTLKDGSTVTGYYDLGTWYNGVNFEKYAAEKEAWGEFLMALKEFGDSLYSYKFGKAAR